MIREIYHPKVIALILSYNGKDLLEDSISSYLANDYPNFEVVVIDNGSTDRTKEYVEKNWPEVKVIRTEKNLGYSGGFNFGLDYAFNQKNADYVLITNNDVKADNKVISELVKVAEKDMMIGFVIGKVYYFDLPDTFQTVGKANDPKYWRGGHIGIMERDIGQYDNNAEREWCDDIFWLVRKEMYDKTDGYDTEFAFQAEDFDWQVRAKKLGYKIFYTPNAKIWHKESMTIGKASPLKAYYDSRNPLIVHLKHRQAEEVRPFLLNQMKNSLCLSLKLLIKLKLKHLFAIWNGLFSALRWGIKNNRLTIKHFI